MSNKPKFDPNKPYTIAANDKPKFDPNQPYEVPQITQQDIDAEDKKALREELLANKLPVLREGTDGANVSPMGLLRGSLEQGPMAGMMAGGALGLRAGPIGGLVGAGIGAAGGTAAKYLGKKAIGDEIPSRPEYYKELGQSALEGASAEAGGPIIGKLAGKGAAIAKDLAETKAVKATGAMLKDFRGLSKRGKVNEVGRQLLDDKIVTPLATPKTIAPRIDEAVKTQGEHLSQLIDDAANATKISKKEFKKWPKDVQQGVVADVKFDPQKTAQKLKQTMREEYSQLPEESLQPAFNEIDKFLGSKKGPMNIKQLQEFKQQFSRFLENSDFYADNPSFGKEGLLAIRRSARKGIEDIGDRAAEMAGDKGGQIKETNRKLSNLLVAQDIAQDMINRNASNRAFGLTDTIAGSAGAAAGALTGGSPEEKVKHAMTYGLLGGGINKLGRTYGPALMATGSNNLSKGLLKLAETNPALYKMLIMRQQQ